MAVVLDEVQPGGASRIRRRRVGAAALVLLLAYGAWLYWLARGTTFRQDEWVWLLYRRGNDLGTFLRPHNQHLSLVPLAVYRLLLATVGARDYGPYRGLSIADHLVLVALVFIYARPRVGLHAAGAAAALLLCLGAGSDVVFWAFEASWLTSLVCGLGALLMLDRGDRRGELWACVLLAVSLASSGIGLVIMLGMAVELAWGRQWRKLWLVALPAVVYGAWWLGYQELGRRSAVGQLPRFVADQIASTLAAVLGLAGNTTGTSAGTLLTFGRPLAVVAVVVVGWRLVRTRGVSARVVGLAAALGAFWVLTAVSRAYIGIAEAWASRYLYVGGLFLILLGVELARGVTVPTLVRVGLGLALAAVAISGSLAMARGARSLRAEAQLTKAELGAMDIARPIISPGYISLVPNFPFPVVLAGPYFSAERADGTPADSAAQIAASSEAARAAADTELIQIHGVRLLAAAACADAPRATSGYLLPLPPRGIVLRADTPVTVAVRRFASRWTAIGGLAPGQSALVRIGPDRARQPWWLELASGTGTWCRAA